MLVLLSLADVNSCSLFKCFFFLLSGIILEYDKGGQLRTKSIDLLDLTPECVSCIIHCKMYEASQQAQWLFDILIFDIYFFLGLLIHIYIR